ncbi:hypothetical protein P4G96_27545 [Bacillus cereus]|nr:hypothetical protein [Bacillus cereus]MEB8671311.1 hypothetical protein [Bacillus cereus]
MSYFKTLLNASQLLTFEELPTELQNEIASINSNEFEDKVLIFKVRKLNISEYKHTVTYIETDVNYYVFTHVILKAGVSIKKQTISKTTISMFKLLHNEDVGLCSQN